MLALVDALETELDALDRLVHALEMQQLALDACRTDLLAAAGRDVEAAVAAVRRADLVRAVSVAAVHVGAHREVRRLERPVVGAPGLADLVAASDDTHAAILSALGRRLRAALAKVLTLADINAAVLAITAGPVGDLGLAAPPTRLPTGSSDLRRDLVAARSSAALWRGIEDSLVDEDDVLAEAIAALQLGAVTAEAALGVLLAVGCCPLTEFLRPAS